MKWIVIILIMNGLFVSGSYAQQQRGNLTILIRDQIGKPVSGLTIRVLYELDDGTRPEIGTYLTNTQGEITLTQTKWGTYIIQFMQLDMGQAIQPIKDQNMAMLDDGSGSGNGYGIYFADQAERLDLFVLDMSATIAIPYFDMATNTNNPPEPFIPLRDNPAPIAVNVPVKANSPTFQPTVGDTVLLLLCVYAILAVIIIGLYGSIRRKEKKS